MILTRMNNYPNKALDQYSKVFSELIAWQNQHTPNNLTFKYFRVGDKVDKDKLINQVERQLPKKFEGFEKLSQAEKEQELHRSSRSIFWNGQLNLTKLKPSEKQKRIIESRLIELTYYETEAKKEYLGDYLWQDDHICICFSFGTTHDNDEFQDLTLGSTYGSIVDHWIGRGILHKRKQKNFPDIVSQKQYQKIKAQLQVIKTDLLPHKNYRQIEVLVEN